MDKRIKIIFFGTPEFAVASLDALVRDGQNIAAVVTMPDKIAGRGHKLIESDVKKYAKEHGLRILQPEKLKSEEFIQQLNEIGADLFIVIAFRMLPEIVWQMPRLGTFNLHASLLPKYRGAAPINWAVINGEKETGVTTFFLKHEIDTGDIIGMEKIEISSEDNVGSVHDKLMELGAEMVLQTVRNIEKGEVNPIPQPEGEFIAAPKIFKETCRINWNQPKEKIHNLVRGLSPYPGAWCKIQFEDDSIEQADMKIFKTQPIESNRNDIKPGEIVIEKDKLLTATAEGLIEIIELQPAGKKRMTAAEFLRGNRNGLFHFE